MFKYGRMWFGLWEIFATNNVSKKIMQPKELLDLAETFGNPLYVYDAEKIETQYNRLTNAFKVEKLRINYAMKALSNISILKLLQHLGSGLDTVSIQEVQLGLHAGFTPDKIIFTPKQSIQNTAGLIYFNLVDAVKKDGTKVNITIR